MGSLPQPTAVMSALCPAAWLLVVLLQLTPSPTSSSISSTISSTNYGSPRDAVLWRADAANAQGPHYRQYLSSPLKLLGGGVPVPATPSQKIALASGLRTLTGLNMVEPRGRPGQRFVGGRRQEVNLGSDQDIEAGGRVSQQPGVVGPPASLRPEQATLEIELHPEEQLGAFSQSN